MASSKELETKDWTPSHNYARSYLQAELHRIAPDLKLGELFSSSQPMRLDCDPWIQSEIRGIQENSKQDQQF